MEEYYTPTIEEFHVGFECEYQEPNEDEWQEEILSDRDVAYLLAYPQKTRVKYLDSEDLVKLGFAHTGGKLVKDLLQDYTLYNGRYYVHLKYSKFQEWASIRIETSVEEDSVRTLVVHSIRIKNKSELVKLMEQLNIQ